MLKELLDKEHTDQMKLNEWTKSLYYKIINSYEINMFRQFIENDRAIIRFNGVVNIEINKGELSLEGFGLRECPGNIKMEYGYKATVYKVYGDLQFIVNALAKYESIYPKQ
jgi:hypothetical protein